MKKKGENAKEGYGTDALLFLMTPFRLYAWQQIKGEKKYKTYFNKKPKTNIKLYKQRKREKKTGHYI